MISPIKIWHLLYLTADNSGDIGSEAGFVSKWVELHTYDDHAWLLCDDYTCSQVDALWYIDAMVLCTINEHDYLKCTI